MSIILGVDPGISGGLAFVNDKIKVIDAMPMPLMKKKHGTGHKNYVDPHALHQFLGMYEFDRCVIEAVHSSPQMGVTSAFSFGRSAGVAIGAVAYWCADIYEVAPSKWKRDLNCPADKEQTIHRAIHPKAGGLLTVTKDRSLPDDAAADQEAIAANAFAFWNLRMLAKRSKKGHLGVRKTDAKDFHDGLVEAALLAYWGHTFLDTER